jgi:hypothetical protein
MNNERRPLPEHLGHVTEEQAAELHRVLTRRLGPDVTQDKIEAWLRSVNGQEIGGLRLTVTGDGLDGLSFKIEKIKL